MRPAILSLVERGEGKVKVTYDGHTVELPNEDGAGVVVLYRRWKAAGKGEEFKVWDATGRLIAIGARLRQLRSI